KKQEFLAGGRVASNYTRVRRGDIHDSVDDQGSRFAGAEAGPAATATASTAGWSAVGRFAFRGAAAASDGRKDDARGLHVIRPCDFETADVLGRDLIQGREAHTSGVVAVGRPFLRGVG